MKNSIRMIQGILWSGFLICSSMLTVSGAPSISNLYKQSGVTVSCESTDGTNTAQLLSAEEIYTNVAVSEQYMQKNADGKPEATLLSAMIDMASGTITETGENGKSIVDDIPSVREILASVSAESVDSYEKEYGYNTDKLEQLTYMQDFKYSETDYRIMQGDWFPKKDGSGSIQLDNGMIEAAIHGGEAIRSASIEDYVIVQVNPETYECYFLTMSAYDEKTGTFTVDFPCIGPYMITMIMN